MNDNYSLDDILAEVDKKKKSPAPKELSEEIINKLNKKNITAELAAIEKKKPSQDLSVTTILAEEKIKAKSEDESEKGRSKTKSERIWERKQAEKTAMEQAEAEAAKKAEERQRLEHRKALAEKQRIAEQRKLEEKKQLEKAKIKDAEEAKSAIKNAVKSEMLDRTIRIDLSQKDKNLFKKDSQLERPEDLIDSINPYDIAQKLGGDTAEVISFPESYKSSDTIGLAGNDLREIAAKKAEASQTALGNQTIAYNSDEVREYHISKTDTLYSKQDRIQERQTAEISREREKRSNTALVENLNKTIKAKRESDIKAQRTLTLADGFNSTIQAPTNGLNIDYKNQIIQETGAVLPLSDPELAEQKLKDLSSKRKRKIKDFVLEDVDEDDYDDEDDEDDENSEFDGYDTTGQIWSDLCESHKGLTVRFFMMLVLSVISGAFAVLNDFGVRLSFDFFGNSVTFLDKAANPGSFVFMNIIFGILALGICASVILNGIGKLFKGRADCDSLCSVAAVLAVIGGVIQLTNPDFLGRGFAHIYIAVGIFGLMFNTLGKLLMIVRAKRNFMFVSGDSHKYFVEPVSEDVASAFTKGIVRELPFLVAMRKTEFLTDFLKNSYCDDRADKISRKLAPLSLLFAVVVGILCFIIPNSADGMTGNIYWATSAGIAALSVLSPFTIMFLVNFPFLRASKSLAKKDAVVLGYEAASDFEGVNAVMVDANLLFPAGSIRFKNIKQCRQTNSINSIMIDEAIILAASIAIKSGSILQYMFYDMLGGKSELMVNVENCIYEDNMGILGWLGNKRMMLGNREHMKHHSIKVPDVQKEQKYASENGEVLYLAVGGEAVAMFFVELIPNNSVKESLYEMAENDISLVIKTRDCLVNVNKLTDLFDYPPEKIKIIPYSMHEKFVESTKYSSRGNGAISCGGKFTSFIKALVISKKLMQDISLTQVVIYAGIFLGAILSLILSLFVMPALLTPSYIIIFNLIMLVIMLAMQGVRKY